MTNLQKNWIKELKEIIDEEIPSKIGIVNNYKGGGTDCSHTIYGEIREVKKRLKDFLRQEKQKSYQEGIQKCLDSLPAEQAKNMQWKNGWNNCLSEIKTNLKKLLNK